MNRQIASSLFERLAISKNKPKYQNYHHYQSKEMFDYAKRNRSKL